MSTTFTQARDDLYLVIQGANIADLTCYSFTPSTATPGTVASIDWDATSTMTEWTIPVRVFTKILDPEDAQTTAALMVDAFESTFDDASLTATFENQYLAELGVLLTVWQVTMPRTDFS